ncbi:MAG: Mur ligase, partial [Pseudomonadota bacterium]
MRMEDSRRLTGPNLFSTLPGAVGDVEIEPAQQSALADAWRRHMLTLLSALGWAGCQLFSRGHATGVSLGITAPMDCLYAATDVNEAAFDLARAELAGEPGADVDDIVVRLRRLIDEERSPALVVLADEAARRRTPFLVDDDDVSLGYGQHAQVYDTRKPPDASDIDWAAAGCEGDVPVALVTGTNGKSTTVRLAAAIVAASGRTAGVTSTDYIRVGDDVIDQGDYSGPGGARQL